jgi:KDO2-lipid IV(A) lauroyltransferase
VADKKRSSLRNWVEFLPAWLLLRSLGLLPRRASIFVGRTLTSIARRLHPRLSRVGQRNLQLAMPELSAPDRARILDSVFANLGRLLGEFSQFPKITSENIGDLVAYDGYENYERAASKGRGVLLLTGHFGAWELCAFAQGAFGHPLSFLVRPLDNPLLDNLVRRHRELSGNRTIDKNNSVRAVLRTLNRGKDVGLLIDANTVGGEGTFCDFFGLKASSTTGLAVFALRSGSPVVPGFLIWDEKLKKHRLRFEPEVPLIRTGDFKEEVRLNTGLFTRVVEEQVRRYPGQWLWIHKRWNTRPEGDPDLYARGATPASASRDRASAKVGAEV